MEGVPEDGYTINVPLLVDNNDENEDKLYENEAEGNTSFFKTCFNGFNALSGFVPMLSLMYNYVCINGAYWIFDVWFKGFVPVLSLMYGYVCINDDY
ncbi:amino acid transporter AVT1J-like isoform X3 [Camellia sinensis]|uniref:amino acid transporter AVT1J-like isoform X3 n=1 Tax=Camellia sinensis TaxID=4442 RepID=UPI001035C2F0|nr:amino acid transporter AVT1J-like isoform X3 [Camellia sinensis]